MSDLTQVRDVWLPASDTHFRQSIEETGSYLIERLRAAITYVAEKEVAVDVGAHVGLYTREMLQCFHEVYAFEPAPDSYACLIRNTENVGDDEVILHTINAAVGREHGTGRLRDDPLPQRIGNTGARYVEPVLSGEVEICTLDELNIPRCDFLKIDCEGGELNVLKGAYATIVRCKPVIMLEVGKTPEDRFGISTRAPLEYLENLGMKVTLQMRADYVMVWPDL